MKHLSDTCNRERKQGESYRQAKNLQQKFKKPTSLIKRNNVELNVAGRASLVELCSPSGTHM